MIKSDHLARIEKVIDHSGISEVIEALLPIGVRPRQLSVRTLLVGILLAISDYRPAHLTRVHQALTCLAEADQFRLGVVVCFRGRLHHLTYRQVEYTVRLVVRLLSRNAPDGKASDLLTEVIHSLLCASIPENYKTTSGSVAVDWTDHESFARPVAKGEIGGYDQQASWGHRRGNHPGEQDEFFFGYYLSLATLVAEESGPDVPEVVMAMNLTSCFLDPVPAFIPVISRLASSGFGLTDVLADTGYANRLPGNWAIPLRILGANIVTDLHPHDRGRTGTFAGAILFNGNLYCPKTPEVLFDISPLGRTASYEAICNNDALAGELARYKQAVVTSDDKDGYWRARCPALSGKLRCPLRENSMTLGFNRPTVLYPPENPPTCCKQASFTVPPSVNAKTRQKHDYPSPLHRKSYARRTAVERSNSRIKDPATVNIERGWCRMVGVVPLSLMIVCALVVTNLAVIDAFDARRAENEQRAAAGLPIKTRKRRRKTLADLMVANAPPQYSAPRTLTVTA